MKKILMHNLILNDLKDEDKVNKDLIMTLSDLKTNINMRGWVTDLEIATKEKSNMVCRFINGAKNDCRRGNLQRIIVKDLVIKA